MEKYQQSFTVPYTYPVLFGHNVLENNMDDLMTLFSDREPVKILVFIDEGIARALPAYVEKIHRFASEHPRIDCVLDPVVVTGGEVIKNDYRLTMEIVDRILESRLCRHSYVLVFGGGAVLDAVGFSASIVHRGIRVIRFPSTVLAQNDAGIGVKNGMNLHGGKNTIGTFAPPAAVVNDAALLEGLDDDGWRDGISEAYKVALLKDPGFFAALNASAEALASRDMPAMQHLVKRCAELHLEHIATSGDPFEAGSARPLDFGHWSAHKIESLSNYTVSHGSAVATGVALDCCYCAEMGWLEPRVCEDLLGGLTQVGFPLWHKEMSLLDGSGKRILFQGLEEFREHLGGNLTLAMIDQPGQPKEIHHVDTDAMNAAIDRLAALHTHRIQA